MAMLASLFCTLVPETERVNEYWELTLGPSEITLKLI